MSVVQNVYNKITAYCFKQIFPRFSKTFSPICILGKFLCHPRFRSNPPEVFYEKDILKINRKFSGEHTYRSVISIKFLGNFIEITLWNGCFPVNLLHILRAPFLCFLVFRPAILCSAFLMEVYRNLLQQFILAIIQGI